MGKTQALDDAQYTIIGRRYGSDDIAKEAIRTKACWARDVGLLASYGNGQAALERFDGLLAEHTRMRESRPEVIAAKRSGLREQGGVFASGRAWVNQAVSVSETRAREDQCLRSVSMLQLLRTARGSTRASELSRPKSPIQRIWIDWMGACTSPCAI